MSGDRPRRPDGPLRIAVVLLMVLGLTQFSFGLVAVPVLGFSTTSADLGLWVQLGRASLCGLAFVGLSTVVGLASMIASVGLVLDRIWAWYLAVGLGFLYVPTGCGLASVPLLYALLEPGSRSYFMWKPDLLDNGGVDPRV